MLMIGSRNVPKFVAMLIKYLNAYETSTGEGVTYKL